MDIILKIRKKTINNRKIETDLIISNLNHMFSFSI